MYIKKYTALILVIALVLLTFPHAREAEAAALTSLSDTMSSSKVSTASSHVLRFTTPTGASDNTDTIIITFPSDYDFSSKTISTIFFTHGATTGAENNEILNATATSTAWAAVLSGSNNRILTLTAPLDGVGTASVAPGDKMIITYTSANAINPTTPGTYSAAITGTFGDSGTLSVPILSDDQVAVSATVAQTLTFSISDNSIGFGTLSSSASHYATGDTLGDTSEVEAHTLIAGTNASGGYTVTVKGATLTSGVNTITAIGGSNTAPSTGSEQFGLRATASGGSGTVTSPYAASGFAYAADASTASQVASATSTSASTTYSLRYLANTSVLTEAGSYTATLTYSATANF